MYSQKDIEEQLKLSNTTARRYVRTFKKRLSPGANAPRKKTYNDDDFIKLSFIRDAYRIRKMKTKEIDAALKDDKFLNAPKPPGSALAIMPEIRQTLERYDATFANLSERQKLTDAALVELADKQTASDWLHIETTNKIVENAQAQDSELESIRIQNQKLTNWFIAISAVGVILSAAIIYLVLFR